MSTADLSKDTKLERKDAPRFDRVPILKVRLGASFQHLRLLEDRMANFCLEKVAEKGKDDPPHGHTASALSLHHPEMMMPSQWRIRLTLRLGMNSF